MRPGVRLASRVEREPDEAPIDLDSECNGLERVMLLAAV